MYILKQVNTHNSQLKKMINSFDNYIGKILPTSLISSMPPISLTRKNILDYSTIPEGEDIVLPTLPMLSK